MNLGVRGERSSSPPPPGDLSLILSGLASDSAFSHSGSQPSNFNYVPMVGGGEELGVGARWLVAPT